MKKVVKFLTFFIPIAWIIISLFLYFLQFSQTEKVCKIIKGCLKIGNKSWTIGLNTNHSYYLDAIKGAFGFGSEKTYQPGPILYILIGISFLYIANMVYERVVEKKRKLQLNFTPFHVLLIFTIIFFIVYNRWISFYNFETPIKYTSIFLKYPAIIASILTIGLVTLSLGSLLLRKTFGDEYLKEEKQLKPLTSFSLGVALLTFALFFMALLGIYKLLPLSILFIVIITISYKEIWYWIKEFFVTKIEIETNYLSAPVLLFGILAIIFAHNFLELIRPIPIGFDDLSVYMTNAKAMADSGHLLHGIMSYYWELFNGLGFVIFKSGTIALFISTLVGLFSLVAIYKLVKDYDTERGYNKNELTIYPILAAVLFYSLPMIIFQSSSDLKVDMAAFMFTTTSFIYFLRWRKKYISGVTENKELYLVAILAGFGFAIKYTNIVFLFVLTLYVIYLVFLKHRFNFKKYLVTIAFLIIALIPVSPILIRNIIQTHSVSISSIRFGKTDDKIIKIDPPFSKEVKEADYNRYMKYNRTEDKEELGRYTGYEKPWKKYLLLPFRLTTNTLTHGLYVDISYIFIIFVPLGYPIYLYVKKKTEVKNTTIQKEILLLAAIFWLIWLFIASGVIWYGLAGMIFLLIIVIETIRYFRENSKLLHAITIILLAMWFIFSLFLKSAFLPSQEIYVDSFGLKYARGDLDQESYFDQRFTTYATIIKKINKDIESHPDNPPKIYRVGTFYKYFITRNNDTVIDDLLLEKFAYASQDDNNNKILQRFKKSGIKYLIVDKSMYDFDKTPDQTLKAKTTKLISFINDNNLNIKLLTDLNDQKTFIAEIK